MHHLHSLYDDWLQHLLLALIICITHHLPTIACLLQEVSFQNAHFAARRVPTHAATAFHLLAAAAVASVAQDGAYQTL